MEKKKNFIQNLIKIFNLVTIYQKNEKQKSFVFAIEKFTVHYPTGHVAHLH